MARECPKCRLLNPDEAQRCDCGYDFESGQMKQSYLTPKRRTAGAGSWLWPAVDDLESAMRATRQACGVAMLCAAVTMVLAGLAMAGVAWARSMGFDAFALGDATLFVIVAVGLSRQSRVAAVAGLVIYLFERVYMIVMTGAGNPAVAVLFTLAFIGGVRGTFAVHRLRGAAPVASA